MATATYEVSDHPIDAKAIVTLIFFILASESTRLPRRAGPDSRYPGHLANTHPSPSLRAANMASPFRPARQFAPQSRRQMAHPHRTGHRARYRRPDTAR